ncbi:MAG: rRNA ((2251)-2-O)-methyltransferase RlmB [Actinomycetota bacterium]|jgi:23S rRNA (guanosine2251-2'-O)-methyltransferase|nr:23S rRNA (guanosine(2251)-2'-O)-methyltransferase RlmB [Actinomycetota bacterium]
MAKIGRPGAAKGKKGAVKGTGGHGRQALEGRGPTPKAEDRPYHKAYKAKKAAAAGVKPKTEARSSRKGEFVAGRSGMGARAISGEVLSGRNSVVEALKAKIPATALFVAQRIEMDDRVKEAMAIANGRGIPLSEVTRAEIDRMTGGDSVHQGIALQVPPYNYKHPMELLDRALSTGQLPLLVALDGVTDPRNLGAIIRSIAAFGGHGVVLPQRRSVGVTAAAWKTSAGAAARMPVALASNLNQTIKEYKQRGVFVIGLDGDGDVMLPEFTLADKPLLVVVGSEGKGLSRLVQENCDQVVSIPITAATESLNAGIAASVALYQISSMRS